MDWVDALHETPDLCGEIEVLDYRAIFIGRYSCVYKGRMKDTRELVAIKVLNPIRGTGLSTMRRKIERERKTWSSLGHPNILPLYGFADDHRLFTPFGAFISPWRARGDLGEFLIEEGEDASLNVRLQLWQGVVAGVDYLHSHQPLLVHGDLKPGNVLINDEGHAQLCDFGLVRVYLKDGHSGMTTASPHCGTDRYLAWELVMAEEDAIPTAASDIYATGCIGLETLFLEKPYSRHVTNVRWHMMIDMQAGNPPAIRPTDLVDQLNLLWDILSWCWELNPPFRPPASVLCAQVANMLSAVEFVDGQAHYWPERRQPSGPRNPPNRLMRGRSPVQSSEDEQSGSMLVYDPDISNSAPAIPSSNGSYDRLSDLAAAINIHKVGIRGDELGKQGIEENIDLCCTGIKEEYSSATYDDATSLRKLAPSVETPGTICGTPLSDIRLKSATVSPVPSDLGTYRSQSIVAETAAKEQLNFASLKAEISRRMHVPSHWNSIPASDSLSQLKDRGMRGTYMGQIEVVASAQSYPFIDAEELLSNQLASPPKIEDFVFSNSGHFRSDTNVSIPNTYRTIPFNPPMAYQYPDSRIVSDMNQKYWDQHPGVQDYGLSSAQSPKNRDAAQYPSVIPKSSGLHAGSGAEFSDSFSQSHPYIFPLGSGANSPRRPLPKLPGGTVNPPSNGLKGTIPLNLIPAVNQVTLDEEDYPSRQSDSQMGPDFPQPRRVSGYSSPRPSTTCSSTTHGRLAFSTAISPELSITGNPPYAISTAHPPVHTAPTIPPPRGSLGTIIIKKGPYGAMDEASDSDTRAPTKGNLFAKPRSRDEIYSASYDSSSEFSASMSHELSKPVTPRIDASPSLLLGGRGGTGAPPDSIMHTKSPRPPGSPRIRASSSTATPGMHHLSTSRSLHVAYRSSPPITTETHINSHLPPASTIHPLPPVPPPRNPARLLAAGIGPKTGGSNDKVDQQRPGLFSLLRPKHFSVWRSRPKASLLAPPSSETPPPIKTGPPSRRATFHLPFSSRYFKEKEISGARAESLIGTFEEKTLRRRTLAVSSAASSSSFPILPRALTPPETGIFFGSNHGTETPLVRRSSTRFSDPAVYLQSGNTAAGELFIPSRRRNSGLDTIKRSAMSTRMPIGLTLGRESTASVVQNLREESASLEWRRLPSRSGDIGVRFCDDDIINTLGQDSIKMAEENPEGVITSSDAAIMADAFRKALRKPEFNAEGKVSDDGSGTAWLRKRKQQREGVRGEMEAQALPPMLPSRKLNTHEFGLDVEEKHVNHIVTMFGESHRRHRPGVSFGTHAPQRSGDNNDRARWTPMGTFNCTSYLTLDHCSASPSRLHSNNSESDSYHTMRAKGTVHNPLVESLSPTQDVDQEEQRETCSVCHITIRARNMERHKRSRHPKHFA